MCISMIKKLFKRAINTAQLNLTISADITVARLTKWQLYVASPDIFALVTEGLKSDPLCNVQKGVIELIKIIPEPDIGFFIAYKKDKPVGFIILQHSEGLLEGCLVLHFYSKGGVGIRRSLMRTAIDFTRQCGMLKLIGMDANDKPHVFCRLFAAPGVTIVPRGRVFEFNLEVLP